MRGYFIVVPPKIEDDKILKNVEVKRLIEDIPLIGEEVFEKIK